MELIELQIDPEFKALIPKLRKAELLQLESNLMTDGCREPIITWNGVIVDGHNRYELCHRHGIPFRIQEMEFDCREAVIAWICSNQLGRRNISEETRKYLIGVQYNTEKIAAGKRNARGVNQYTVEDQSEPMEEVDSTENKHKTAARIADEHHIAYATVQKYSNYSRALDEIAKHEPKLVAKILSGNYKISHKNVIELAKLTPEEIRRVNRRIDSNSALFVQYKRTRSVITPSRTETSVTDEPQGPSVKDMPAFDPDAEISSLTLTIPSWSSSIERTRSRADLSIISPVAKNSLIGALQSLQDTVDEMLKAVKEAEK